jgi:hypothetical protein
VANIATLLRNAHMYGGRHFAHNDVDDDNNKAAAAAGTQNNDLVLGHRPISALLAAERAKLSSSPAEPEENDISSSSSSSINSHYAHWDQGSMFSAAAQMRNRLSRTLEALESHVYGQHKQMKKDLQELRKRVSVQTQTAAEGQAGQGQGQQLNMPKTQAPAEEAPTELPSNVPQRDNNNNNSENSQAWSLQ